MVTAVVEGNVWILCEKFIGDNWYASHLSNFLNQIIHKFITHSDWVVYNGRSPIVGLRLKEKSQSTVGGGNWIFKKRRGSCYTGLPAQLKGPIPGFSRIFQDKKVHFPGLFWDSRIFQEAGNSVMRVSLNYNFWYLD